MSTPEDLLKRAPAITAQLKSIHATTPHPDSVPGLSENDRNALHATRTERARLLMALDWHAEALAETQARLTVITAKRTKVDQVIHDLTEQIQNAPPPPAGMAGNHARQHLDALRDAIRGLTRGVEWSNGRPGTPDFVLEALGGSWLGSLMGLEDQRVELEARLTNDIATLTGTVTAAEALIAATPKSVEASREPVTAKR